MTTRKSQQGRRRLPQGKMSSWIWRVLREDVLNLSVSDDPRSTTCSNSLETRELEAFLFINLEFISYFYVNFI
ncbi:hypothetical protein Scep_023303 [Stephania cephalantha]|uniref:Uncharacterized protein n=1 Tax=Stephania cephalantha TaxID=152367 RepID=A0AAP0EZZ0_9MAGN